jgi:hypothetical protein
MGLKGRRDGRSAGEGYQGNVQRDLVNNISVVGYKMLISKDKSPKIERFQGFLYIHFCLSQK